MKEIIRKSDFLRGNQLITKDCLSTFSLPQTNCKWLNPYLIYSVWDIGYKLGILALESQTKKVQVFFEYPGLLTIQMNANGFALFRPENRDSPEKQFIVFDLKNGLKMVFDRDLNYLDLNFFIGAIQVICHKDGLIKDGKIVFREDVF